MAPVTMNIVRYRYNRGGLDGEQVNPLSTELLMRLQEQVVAAPQSTVLNGNYVIRVGKHQSAYTPCVHLDEIS